MPLLVPDKVNMNYANMIEEKNLKVSHAMSFDCAWEDELQYLTMNTRRRKPSS